MFRNTFSAVLRRPLKTDFNVNLKLNNLKILYLMVFHVRWIYIEDINDNPPVFTQPAYEVSISEGTPVTTSILTVMATNPDVNTDEGLQ